MTERRFTQRRKVGKDAKKYDVTVVLPFCEDFLCVFAHFAFLREIAFVD